MSFAAVENIVQTLLYEGYLLYPYRPSALKNRQRWLFGRLVPREFSLATGEAEAWRIQTECLIRGSLQTELELSVRFLQLAGHANGNADVVSDQTVERTVPARLKLEQITSCAWRTTFEFPPKLEGAVTLAAAEALPGLFKLTVVVENLTSAAAGPDLDRALHQSLLSTLTLLRVTNGEFVSLLDPPEPCRDAAASCQNKGTWPVLVGQEPGQMLLSAPIILYDYPQVAPESPGDLFDGTEIDEILSLRIQTLTETEKREMSASSERANALLARTEALTDDQRLNLHGRMHAWPQASEADSTQAHECSFRSGDRVRLRPRRGADALDLLFSGQTATIVSVQRDFEDGIHLGVTLDDDPGRDFGEQGLPGHRFFYRPEEVERL